MKLLLVVSCLAATAVAQSDLNIVDVARRNGLYSFIFALEETNNLELLSKAENVTVFVPTNNAFKNVSVTERNKWRSNPSYYQDLLRYHVVVNGRFMKSDLVDEDQYNTSSKAWPTARFVNYDGFSLNVQTYQDAVISTFDIVASNGVIHLLDQVVQAPQNQTILQILESRMDLSNITAVVKNDTMITSWLDGSKPTSPVTLLAPNNEAIGKIAPEVWNRLISNASALQEVLQYHVLDQGTWFSRGLKDGLTVSTLNKNGNRTAKFETNGIFFDKAKVVVADLAAVNGVAHIVDTLILPPPGFF